MGENEKLLDEVLVFLEVFDDMSFRHGYMSKQAKEHAKFFLEKRRKSKFNAATLRRSMSEARETLKSLSDWPKEQKNDVISLVKEKIGYSPEVFGRTRDVAIVSVLKLPTEELNEDDMRELRDYVSDCPEGPLVSQVIEKLSETGLEI